MRTVKLPLRRTYVHRNMNGHGLGGLFARLARMVTPLVKTAVRAAKPIAKQTLKELGKQGLHAASSTLTDVIEGGVPFREAVKKNAKKALPAATRTTLMGAKRAAMAGTSQLQKPIKRPKLNGNTQNKKKIRGRGSRGIFS